MALKAPLVGAAANISPGGPAACSELKTRCNRPEARGNIVRAPPHFDNNAKMLSEAAAGREEPRQVFARDRAQFETKKRSAGRKE